MISILNRHEDLGMDAAEPLAVYKRNTFSLRGSFITKFEVQRRMTLAARAVYPSTPFTKKYTLHSCRIGATALLFARYRDPELTRTQLRWDSEKWREYIRFTPINAALHHGKAVADVLMPLVTSPVSHARPQHTAVDARVASKQCMRGVPNGQNRRGGPRVTERPSGPQLKHAPP